MDEFTAIGCKVAACSVDSKFSHLAWIETSRSKGGLGKMRIPVIAGEQRSGSSSSSSGKQHLEQRAHASVLFA